MVFTDDSNVSSDTLKPVSPSDSSQWTANAVSSLFLATVAEYHLFWLMIFYEMWHLLFLSPVTRLIIGLSAGLASKSWARIKAAFISTFVLFAR